ncbi:MAG: NifB/NifX family molybdenum-iron cluster-binding protein [Geobacter sp.]|nr:NifB/NifX family molybdenum-iron cluster-binding protein [Geobacter sp.]
MNKIAFSTAGQELSAALDPRFGRAARFLIYDMQLKSVQIIENQQARSAAQGAGIQAAETVVKAGIDTLVTGHCGPKAFKVLNAAGVQVFNCDAATVDEALHALQAGSLTAAAASDVEGHW